MAFTLFCREFRNVVNRAFLVLIFWVNKLVGANFTRFCIYGEPRREKCTCDKCTLPTIPLGLAGVRPALGLVL